MFLVILFWLLAIASGVLAILVAVACGMAEHNDDRRNAQILFVLACFVMIVAVAFAMLAGTLYGTS